MRVHAVVLLAVSLLGVHAGCGAPGERLNLVLITVDSLRADRLGVNGHDGARTPTIDALAARGALFTRAWAPVPEATPALASLMTGMYPPRHGLRTSFSGALGPTQTLSPATPTLAQHLKEAGYKTGAVASSLLLHPKYGLSRGFDSYAASFEDVGRLGESAEIGVPAQRVADLALEFLEGARGSSFFLWVNFHDPHYFYTPPEPFATEFKGRPYDGEVAYVDRELSRILDRVREYALEAETIVLLAGSNGEALGDRGEAYHGVTLQEATTRVPLILAVPGRDAFSGGRRVDGPVSLVDVAPTMLDLIGVSPLPSTDGVSLAAPQDARPLYLETQLPAGLFGWSRLTGVLEGDWKYVEGSRGELFNLAADPRESEDVSAEHPDVRARLASLISAYTAKAPAAAGLPAGEVAAVTELGYPVEAPARELPDPRDRASIANEAMRGDRSVRRRALQSAYMMLSGVLREDPDNFIALVDAAIMSRGAGDFGGAKMLLERAQGLYPGSAEVYHLLGHVTAAAGPDAADRTQRLYAVAATLDRLNEEALYDLACALAVKGQTADALARLEQAIKAGFRDFEWMSKDSDLDGLRSDPRFEAITEGRARRNEEPEAPAAAAAP